MPEIWERIDDVTNWDSISDLDSIRIQASCTALCIALVEAVAEKCLPISGLATATSVTEATTIRRLFASCDLNAVASIFGSVAIVMPVYGDAACGAFTEQIVNLILSAQADILATADTFCNGNAKYAIQASALGVSFSNMLTWKKYWATEAIKGQTKSRQDKISGAVYLRQGSIIGNNISKQDKVAA